MSVWLCVFHCLWGHEIAPEPEGPRAQTHTVISSSPPFRPLPLPPYSAPHVAALVGATDARTRDSSRLAARYPTPPHPIPPVFPRRPLSRPESHLSVNLSNLPLRRRGEKVIPGDTDPETRGVWKWCHGRDGAPNGARMQTYTNILKKRPPEVQIHGMKQSIFSKGGWNFHFLSHFLRHLNMKRPRYSEGFVSTMSACVCVCVSYYTQRGLG